MPDAGCRLCQGMRCSLSSSRPVSCRRVSNISKGSLISTRSNASSRRSSNFRSARSNFMASWASRVVSFGWRYDFNGGGLTRTEEIPAFLMLVREQAALFAQMPAQDLQQVLVTEYSRGAAIG
jgi:hypothetical protein